MQVKLGMIVGKGFGLGGYSGLVLQKVRLGTLQFAFGWPFCVGWTHPRPNWTDPEPPCARRSCESGKVVPAKPPVNTRNVVVINDASPSSPSVSADAMASAPASVLSSRPCIVMNSILSGLSADGTPTPAGAAHAWRTTSACPIVSCACPRATCSMWRKPSKDAQSAGHWSPRIPCPLASDTVACAPSTAIPREVAHMV
jgi:hypothetical protein